MKNFFIYLLPLFFFPLFSFASEQNEQITQFDSQISVNQNASLDISEQITVYANQQQIKHGIVRYFPTSYKDSYGINRHTTYEINKILVNGVPSPYLLKRENKELRIYIGDAQTDLSPGYYTYTIDYHVKNAINFLKDGDELYWNVTGNKWKFPILKATAKIILPKNASILAYSGYTGLLGMKEKNFTVLRPQSNEIIYRTNHSLSPDMGLTIAVAWPKGFVQQPSWYQVVKNQLQLNVYQYFIFLIAFFLLFYYFIIWFFHGKDPRKGTIIPLFEPPNGLSPTAVRYVTRMGVDMKDLPVAIVSMATKKFLTIKDTHGSYSIIKIGDETSLSPDEKAAAQQLFAKTNELPLTDSYFEQITYSLNALGKNLKENYRRYFITNTSFWILGLILSLIALIATIKSADDQGNAFFAMVWLSGWTIGVAFLLYKAWKSVQSAWNFLSFKLIMGALLSVLILIPFLIGEIFGIIIFSSVLPIFTIPLMFLIIVLDVVFYILLKAPTPEGRKLLDQIEGFKLFLNTTERYRLNELYPPEKIPEIFEKFLPYALALDVENQWGDKFNAALKNAGIDPRTYQPTWYAGAPFAAGTFANFPASLSSTLSSSLSSTSVSSSASGGRGSSGGGGGGGGGGGW